jgi:hypothetical protein
MTTAPPRDAGTMPYPQAGTNRFLSDTETPFGKKRL